MLPLATSAVTIGLGYLIAFGQSPFNWRASLLMLPIAHAVVAVPFVMRAVLPGFAASSRPCAKRRPFWGWWLAVWWEVDWPAHPPADSGWNPVRLHHQFGRIRRRSFLAREGLPCAGYLSLSGPTGGFKLWSGVGDERPANAGLRQGLSGY